MHTRIIAHLDMDAFFASVEEREKPYLRGLPVVVGADPKGGAGRGVVSTANYAARRYGIGSAMPISRAWRLSEEARLRGESACAFIVPRHEKYSRTSADVFAVVQTFSPVFEQVSVDEGYIDFSHYGSFRRATEAAERLKRAIKRKTKLVCSIGIAPNKLVAKIASDAQKPDGLTVVLPRQTETFLAPFSVRAIPGVGPRAAEVLNRKGMKTVADARALSWQEMEGMFGKWGFALYERLRGIDERPLVEESVRKSIGRHNTFAEDTNDMEEIFAELRSQSKRVIRDMKERGFSGFRTAVLTVRFDDFTIKTRSLTVTEPLAGEEELAMKAVKLALPFFDRQENPDKKLIRLIGVRIEKLC